MVYKNISDILIKAQNVPFYIEPKLPWANYKQNISGKADDTKRTRVKDASAW